MSFLQDAIDGAQDTVDDAVSGAQDTVNDGWDNAVDTTNDAVDDAQDAVNDGWDDATDAASNASAEGIVERTIGDKSPVNVQDAAQAAGKAVTGAEDSDELAEQVQNLDEGYTEFVDNKTEGTILDNAATDAARSAGDLFIADPARSASRIFADIDPETGEDDAKADAMDVFDVGATVATAGVGGAVAKGGSKAAKLADIGGLADKAGDAVRGVDDAGDIVRPFASGADEAADTAVSRLKSALGASDDTTDPFRPFASGSDEAAGTAAKTADDAASAADDTTDPFRPFASGSDEAGDSITDRLSGISPSAGQAAAGAGVSGLLAGGALTTFGDSGSGSSTSDSGSGSSTSGSGTTPDFIMADDTGSGSSTNDSGSGSSTSGSGTTPPFMTTGDGDGTEDDGNGSEWGELNRVEVLGDGWVLAVQTLVDGSRTRYFVLGGPSGSGYLQPGGGVVEPGPNEGLNQMPSYNTKSDAREAHAAWAEENDREKDEKEDDRPTWTEWQELQKSGPWHVYTRSHREEDRSQFQAAGVNGDGATVYLGPDGDIVDEAHIFESIDALTSALEAYASDGNRDESDSPNGQRPPNSDIRSGAESDSESDSSQSDGGVASAVAENPLLAAGAVGAAAVGVAVYGGDA